MIKKKTQTSIVDPIVNVKSGLGSEGSTAGKSIKRHGKSMLGRPLLAIPNTFISYCPPGLKPWVYKIFVNNIL